MMHHTRQWQLVLMRDTDADGLRQMRNTAMVISDGNGNMLGNIIDVADGVRTSNAQHGNVKK